MKIRKCSICDRPFFPEIRTVGNDKFIDLDPDACPQCNEDARKNSERPTINNKTY